MTSPEGEHEDQAREKMLATLKAIHVRIKSHTPDPKFLDFHMADGRVVTEHLKEAVRFTEGPYCDDCGAYTEVSELDENNRCESCSDSRAADREPDTNDLD